jgi:hypothetical protein
LNSRSQPWLQNKEIVLVESCPIPAVSLVLGDYLQWFKGQELAPLSMEALLRPFGLKSNQTYEDPSLLLGIFLEGLQDYCDEQGESFVDPMDIALVAQGLDFAPAEQFLSEAPYLLMSIFKGG